MTEPLNFSIRPNLPAVRTEATAIAQRLAENGIPPWRDPIKALDWHDCATESIFEEAAPGDAIDVAEASDGEVCGFIVLRSRKDLMTGEVQGHISDFAVTQAAEGRGAAQTWMTSAEEWARGRGFRCLALDVFAMNHHARAIYARTGFGEQKLKMVKVFSQP
jgi:ribosomal protein S18 acetylase RimI-like enzyme